jgi:hypothetical protein
MLLKRAEERAFEANMARAGGARRKRNTEHEANLRRHDAKAKARARAKRRGARRK